MSADVEEDGDEFMLTLNFKLHEPPRPRHHSDDDSPLSESDTGYRLRGVSRDLLRSYITARRPSSSYKTRRCHSVGV